MNIVAFCVLVECPGCKGAKQVPGGQREYGELVWCQRCNGSGTIPGTVDYADFARLIKGVSRL